MAHKKNKRQKRRGHACPSALSNEARATATRSDPPVPATSWQRRWRVCKTAAAIISPAVAVIAAIIALWQTAATTQQTQIFAQQLEVAKKEFNLHELATSAQFSPAFRFESELLAEAPNLSVINEGAHLPLFAGSCTAYLQAGGHRVEIKNYYTVAHTNMSDKDSLRFYFDRSLADSTWGGLIWKGSDPLNIAGPDERGWHLRTFMDLQLWDSRGATRHEYYDMAPTAEFATQVPERPVFDSSVDLSDFREGAPTDRGGRRLNLARLVGTLKEKLR